MRLRSGRFPHPKLLEKHGLASMLPLVQAVKVGDLRTFNSELKRHQRALVKKGTFLLLEQSKILVYRNLFKKVFLVNGSQTQLKLHLFERALQCLGEPTDLAEVECVVANPDLQGLREGLHQPPEGRARRVEEGPVSHRRRNEEVVFIRSPRARRRPRAATAPHSNPRGSRCGGPSRPGRRARRRVLICLDGAARDLFIRLLAARASFSSRQAALVPSPQRGLRRIHTIHPHVHAQPPRERRRRVVGPQRLQCCGGPQHHPFGTARLYRCESCAS